MTYEETLAKIKSLEIQGAERIAIAGVQAFAEKLRETDDEKKLRGYADELGHARATEPALRNGLRYCLLHFKKNPDAAAFVIEHFEKSRKKIAEIGAQKVADGMKIFTHCHAGTVTAILRTAWEQGRRFTVHTTETRPKFQGRKTARELAEIGIPVTHSIDSAGLLAMKKADIFLFGADAITSEGNVINKIGTGIFAEFAASYHMPAYSCTNSWKFDPETVFGAEEPIEQRDPKEVWEDAPSGVTVINPAFEITRADRITGLITELGVFKPETLVTEIKKAYPWMI